ncbi:MAG: hypothetical protein ABI946_07265, partial [Chthoniobacterales bacterium]
MQNENLLLAGLNACLRSSLPSVSRFMHTGKRCALLLLAALCTSPLRATEWKVIHINNRDYVTFANLADF